MQLKRIKAEKVFLFFALIWGMSLVFITPPFQVPDEQAHFFRAYQISEFTLVPEVEENLLGGEVPKSLVDLLLLYNHGHLDSTGDFNWKHIEAGLKIKSNEKEREFMIFPNTALYSPTLFIPQTSGIWLGKMMNLPPLVLFYLARIFNLMAWIMIIYFVIRLVPFKKWLFTILALTPMALCLSASVNSDVLVIAYSFLFIAYVFRVAFDPAKKPDNRTFVILILLSVLVALSKNIYFFLCFLFFLIPVSKAASKKKYLTGMVLFLVTTLVSALASSFMINRILSQVDTIEMMYGGGIFPKINPAKQVEFILSDIPGFIKIVFHSFTERWMMVAKSYIGILGWMSIYLSNVYYLFAYSSILLVALYSGKVNPVININHKLLLLGISIVVIFAFSFTMYCSWTEPGAMRIDNLQSRYFMPVAPLIWLLFQNRKLNANKLFFVILTMAYGLFSMLETWRHLLQRFYF